MEQIEYPGEKSQKSSGADVVILQWARHILAATVWTSAGLFGLYIIAFYAAALARGDMDQWNNILPGLYREGARSATSGIGLHFAAGGIILLLGSVQLIKMIRINYPAFHRWVGRIYVAACVLAASGGLLFILLEGTIGGTVMDIGFSLYGLLMLVSAIETYRHARAQRIEQHRAWALRLYALAIGSWLYRMDYGFWFLIAGRLGHLPNFSGPLDQVMAFFFYVPNLVVVEIFIRSQKAKHGFVFNVASSLILLLVTGFLAVGTYYFTKFYWGPAILKWLSVG